MLVGPDRAVAKTARELPRNEVTEHISEEEKIPSHLHLLLERPALCRSDLFLITCHEITPAGCNVLFIYQTLSWRNDNQNIINFKWKRFDWLPWSAKKAKLPCFRTVIQFQGSANCCTSLFKSLRVAGLTFRRYVLISWYLSGSRQAGSRELRVDYLRLLLLLRLHAFANVIVKTLLWLEFQ